MVYNEYGQKVRIGRRGVTFYGKPDLEGILTKELRGLKGRLLVTGQWSQVLWLFS